MRVVIDPPWADWRLAPGGPGTPDRRALGDCCAGAPRGVVDLAPGQARTPLADTRRIVATGHQAWLWHPGVLAKYIAAAHAAKAMDATALAVIVDHDVHNALRLDLPIRQGDRLSVRSVDLAPSRAGLPIGAQMPADPATVLANLRDAAGQTALDLRPLMEAWTDLPAASSLADQVALVLGRLMRPYTGDMATAHASDLMELPPARELMGRMLREATVCIRAYNRAVSELPHMGIEMLSLGREMVELPLWHWTPGSPRRKVYAGLAGADASLTTGDGREIDLDHLSPADHLAPRALMLTALMRWAFCDLFIHGIGGSRYDQITERWWQLWTGGEPAPKAMVTADVLLPLDVPVCTAEQLHRAQWWVHHLPHNIDRVAKDLDGEARGWEAQKSGTLAHMNDDRDRRRRATAFAQLHDLNARLAKVRPALVQAARRELDAALAGVANRVVAGRRDWCFALYPPAQLQELGEALRPAPR
jgi:hypothetical protein